MSSKNSYKAKCPEDFSCQKTYKLLTRADTGDSFLKHHINIAKQIIHQQYVGVFFIKKRILKNLV